MSTVQDLCIAYTIGDQLQFDHLLSQYDCVIVEGYECVGKSHFIRGLQSRGFPTYRPSYEAGMDNLIDRSMRALPGIIAVDAHRQGNSRLPLVLDRGLPSGLVYGHLLQGKNYADYRDMISLFNNICGRVLIIYKYHSCESDAKYIHSLAMESRDKLDEYDTEDFDIYCNEYAKFEYKFSEVFKFLGCDVLGINSMDTESSALLAGSW